jgi:hypothetical protein
MISAVTAMLPSAMPPKQTIPAEKRSAMVSVSRLPETEFISEQGALDEVRLTLRIISRYGA